MRRQDPAQQVAARGEIGRADPAADARVARHRLVGQGPTDPGEFFDLSGEIVDDHQRLAFISEKPDMDVVAWQRRRSFDPCHARRLASVALPIQLLDPPAPTDATAGGDSIGFAYETCMMDRCVALSA